MAIPKMQTESREINQLQQYIAQALNPILSNPENLGTITTNVQLVAGTNVVNHGLGKKLQGWSIVRKRSAAGIYDNQDSNPNPAKTLILVSDAAVSIDLYCF